jgi:streptomycin 6-kinase
MHVEGHYVYLRVSGQAKRRQTTRMNNLNNIYLSDVQLQKIGVNKNLDEINRHLYGIINIINSSHKLQFVETLEGGTSAFTALLKNNEGVEFVAKIPFHKHKSELDFEKEIKALEIADGKGYVKILFKDDLLRYVILEKLGKPLGSFNLTTQNQIKIIVKTLKKSWAISPTTDIGLVGPYEILNWFQNFINKSWEEQGKPFSIELKDKISSVIYERKNQIDPQKNILVHGDPNNMNILKYINSDEDEFKFIDPDGIVCEPEYDMGVLMREWIDELFPDCQKQTNHRADFLAEITGLNKVSIYHWGLIQFVATGLVLYGANQVDEAKRMFEVADIWTI